MDNIKNILIYTFRTFNYVNDLYKINKDIYVFGKLKSDLNEFYHIIDIKKPKYILGIAKNRNKISEFESITINNFNNKKVSNTENFEYKLFVPELLKTPFMIANGYTTSFCNYSMFKIMEYIKEKNINTKFSFAHVKKEDITKLAEIYK